MAVKQKRLQIYDLQPFKRFDNNSCSGNEQYLEHLIAFLEVLEAILENDNENHDSLKSTKRQ
jgi:hypothetical protein